MKLYDIIEEHRREVVISRQSINDRNDPMDLEDESDEHLRGYVRALIWVEEMMNDYAEKIKGRR